MKRSSENKRPTSFVWWLLVAFGALATLLLLPLNLYRPDRPIATIIPGSSDEPAFVVQVIRPREGLPVGGLLPPELFGVDAQLGFDSQSDDSNYTLKSDVLDLSDVGWMLHLSFDAQGQIQPESEVVFDLVFQDRVRRVRCAPGDPVVGRFQINEVAAGEFSGDFEIELPVCEDAETGQSLRWPPQPLRLRGSFDRLPMNDSPEK